MHTGFWCKNLREVDRLKDPEDNTEINIRKVGWKHGVDSYGSGQGQVASSCECGNELSGCIECGEFPE